jgi:hypothetical protein
MTATLIHLEEVGTRNSGVSFALCGRRVSFISIGTEAEVSCSRCAARAQSKAAPTEG